MAPNDFAEFHRRLPVYNVIDAVDLFALGTYEYSRLPRAFESASDALFYLFIISFLCDINVFVPDGSAGFCNSCEPRGPLRLRASSACASR